MKEIISIEKNNKYYAFIFDPTAFIERVFTTYC